MMLLLYCCWHCCCCCWAYNYSMPLNLLGARSTCALRKTVHHRCCWSTRALCRCQGREWRKEGQQIFAGKKALYTGLHGRARNRNSSKRVECTRRFLANVISRFPTKSLSPSPSQSTFSFILFFLFPLYATASTSKVNHSANSRVQCELATAACPSIGEVQHVTAFMGSVNEWSRVISMQWTFWWSVICSLEQWSSFCPRYTSRTSMIFLCARPSYGCLKIWSSQHGQNPLVQCWGTDLGKRPFLQLLNYCFYA